jgi:hypothetical protein
MFSWGELAAWGGSGAVGGVTLTSYLSVGGPPGWLVQGATAGTGACIAILAGVNKAYTDFQTEINNEYPGENVKGKVWGVVTSTIFTNVNESSREIATWEYWVSNSFGQTPG